jgi:hypothetical protein
MNNKMCARCGSLVLVLLFTFLLCATVPAFASSSSSTGRVQQQQPEPKTEHDVYGWEEEVPPVVRSPAVGAVERANDSQQQRPLLQLGPSSFERQSVFRKRKSQQPKSHPMRTNVWKIRFTSRNRKFVTNETMIIEFDPLGYCRVETTPGQDDRRSEHYVVGTWNMIPAGVLWEIPRLQFWAELHLQPFGDHPRMLRGVVVRERYVLVLCLLASSKTVSIPET